MSSLEPPIDEATATATRLAALKKLDDGKREFDTPVGLNGPFCLNCSYCNWSSLEIGIKLERYTNVTGQLARVKNGGQPVRPAKETLEMRQDRRRRGENEEDLPLDPLDVDNLFSNMIAFYKSQLSEVSDGGPYGSSHNFDSPSSITRIMNLHSGAKRTNREKAKPMREAHTLDEGFRVLNETNDDHVIERMRTLGWEQTTSMSQRTLQPRENTRFLDDLRPVAPHLRAKRIKRCQTCRTLLSQPDTKVQSTRYKIKQLALQHIPKLSIRALAPTPTPTPTTSSSTTATQRQQQPFDYTRLRPLTPVHFLLTLHNPLFDAIRVTLATPGTTPGKIGSRVTVLCPQFDVGANTDVWDAALDPGSSTASSSTTGNRAPPSSGDAPAQAEAGKPWAAGRNWTAVVLEVVPGMAPEADDDDDDDDDVLEIPLFVRVEYETPASSWEDDPREVLRERMAARREGREERERERAEVRARERREEAFWAVLGVGRIVG